MTQFARGKDMSQHPLSRVTEALTSFLMALDMDTDGAARGIVTRQ